MSQLSYNRFGNISKVKYFLPGNRIKRNTQQAQSYIQSRGPTRKQSVQQQNSKSVHQINESTFSKHDLSFQVVGVSDVQEQEHPKSENNQIFKMFPEGKQRQDFLKFVETLKNDQSYQNTITMFTIMYYYEKKTGQKVGTFL